MLSRDQQRIHVAVSAGFHVFLALILLSTVVVIPLLSQSQEFNHTHPENTPFHTHNLTTLFAVQHSPIPASQSPAKVSFSSELISHSVILSSAFRIGFLTRAPPHI